MSQLIKIFTDGGSFGNPGPSASAYVIYKDEEIIEKKGKPIGHATNNIAEYKALIFALSRIKELINGGELSPLKIEVYADSNLLVNQMNGLYKVKNPQLRSFIMEIRVLEGELNLPISYTHIYREENMLADSLVKKALTVGS